MHTNHLLHRFLFVGQRDVHLLERDLVQRSGHFQTFRLLILAQALPRRIIQFSQLFSRVEAARFKQRLRLVDLFLRGPKNGAAFGLFGRLRCGSEGSCGLGHRCCEDTEKWQSKRKEFLHLFFVLLVRRAEARG